MEATANYETIGHWIDRSRRGDRDAFACLVQQYQGMVSGVALSRTGDIHQSEDLAQETFLLAWQKLAELEDAAKFPGWICSIARNLARNAVRKKSETEQTGTPLEAESTSADPMESLVTAEQNALIGAALQKIPENYREPLILFYRGEQSTKQIADALDITEEAARQRLSRARKFLRKELERQVADVISSSGPSEFFSLAVIAALPAAALFTSTGKAVAAATLSAEPVFAASAMVAAPKSGGGSFSLFGMSSPWWYSVYAVSSYACSIFAMFFWIVGAVPGFWFSIRNAPTLRTRRFLILSSLRIHVLFGVVVLYCFLFPAAQRYFNHFFRGGWDHRFFETVFDQGFYGGLCVIGAVVVFFLVDAPVVYRRILREDVGLIVPKKSVPLEESPLSFARLQKSCFRSGIALFLLLAAAWLSFYLKTELERTLYAAYFPYSASFTEWGKYWDHFGKFYVYGALAGVVFLLVFRQMHRAFLAMAKDETSFAAAPPLTDRETPFSERVFIEWVVSFGFFIAATLAYLQGVMQLTIHPQWPVTFLAILVFMVGGTWILAAISAAVPTFRWFINLSGFGVLFAASAYSLYQAIRSNGIERFLPDFFATTQAWPVVFGIMFLDWIIAFGTLLALAFGGFYLRNKWKNGPTSPNGFLSRKGFATAFCTGIILILLVSPWGYSWNRMLYYNRVLRDMDQSTKGPEPVEFVEKRIVLATTIIDWEKDRPRYQAGTLQDRARDYLKLGKFSNAVADYDRLIEFYTDWPGDETKKQMLSNFHASRGEARLAAGDAQGALEDIDKVPRDTPLWGNREYADMLYNRGYAHEKLGETAAAIADYDDVIRLLETKPFKEQRRVCSVAARKGYDDEKHRSTLYWDPGFRISLEELSKIRDGLQH